MMPHAAVTAPAGNSVVGITVADGMASQSLSQTKKSKANRVGSHFLQAFTGMGWVSTRVRWLSRGNGRSSTL